MKSFQNFFLKKKGNTWEREREREREREISPFAHHGTTRSRTAQKVDPSENTGTFGSNVV